MDCSPPNLAAPRCLDRCDVDLSHAHHSLKRALCFIAAGRHRFGQYTRRDLPRHAPLVLAPAARALLAAIADDGVPIAIGLGLIVSGDHERKGFAVLELRTAVEADTGDAGNLEFDHQHISLLAGWVVTGCTPDGAHCAVWKGLGIKSSSGLGILIVPDADCVLCHCMSFHSEARGAKHHVRYVPVADVNGMSGAAASAGEFGVSLGACILQRWRHTRSHCRSHDCPPKYCLCGSSLRTSDTGSPNSYYLGLIGSPRTRGPGKPGPAVARKTHRQDRRWQLKSCGSSSTSVLPEPADFHANAARNKLPFSAPCGQP